MTSTTFRDSMRTLLRDRLLDAAADITTGDGWGSVTMAKIAERVGVSRQTVYNELGSKPEIAQELVMRELGRFLEVVRERFRAEDDPVASIRAACEGALTLAESNPLLKAALDTASGGESDLLPLLTTRSEGLIDVASAAVSELLSEQYDDLPLTADELVTAVDSIVRMVLSHVMRPARPASQSADRIAWIVERVLRH